MGGGDTALHTADNNSNRRIWIFDGLSINNDHLNFDDHKPDGSTDHGVIRATFKYSPAKG